MIAGFFDREICFRHPDPVSSYIERRESLLSVQLHRCKPGKTQAVSDIDHVDRIGLLLHHLDAARVSILDPLVVEPFLRRHHFGKQDQKKQEDPAEQSQFDNILPLAILHIRTPHKSDLRADTLFRTRRTEEW